MELLADRDPEEARKLLDPVLEHMMEAVHRYEGTVNQVMGDGIMALFGAPLAHEDHAVRACYAALRMQESVKRYAEGVRGSTASTVQIRVGLNSGEVVVRAIGSDLHMDYTAVGQTTHLAARMEQLAEPGAIAADRRDAARSPRATSGQVARARAGEGAGRARRGVRADRGRRRRAPDCRRRPPAGSRASWAATPRSSSCAGLLEQARQRAAARWSPSSARPGVGKSRLTYEFTHSHRVQGWLILEAGVGLLRQGHELPAGDRPAQGLLQDRRPGRPPRDPREGDGKAAHPGPRARAAAARRCWRCSTCRSRTPPWQTLDPPQRRQRTLDAVKRLLLRESQVQPLLVVFEDLHWIDWRDPGAARQPRREPAAGAPPAPRQLPPRVPAPLGQQDLLLPAPARHPASPRARRAAGGAPRGGPGLGPLTQMLVERTRQSILPGGDGADAGGDAGRWWASAGRTG